ncbi:MAG: ABC-F family ATP-binding cassette domain-containing protein, partial [Bacteroidetes bacterium]|nr:ABC-F family ATP-binding cassette domain-containing protein [Bacteroidota bacterium]
MNYLSAENLSKYIGDRILFEGLSFGINRGEKIALIAQNGAGKTSLLRILSGQKTADNGTVLRREGIKIGYLEQEPSLDNRSSINEFIKGSHSEVLSIIRKYEAALSAQTESYNDVSQRNFESASAEMDKNNAWDYELRLKQMLSRFNITQLDQKIGTLSGGEKKRLALALVLLDEPELLILDEPTNHLDIDMIEWLEKFLLYANVTVLMVTHDRYFLDRVCNHIFEISDQKLYHHKGNYACYLEKSFEREEVEKTEIEKARKLMRKELDWMHRMPKARTTKSKARIDSFYKTRDKAQSGIVKQEIKLDVKSGRIGGKILELEKINKSYGDINIIENFDYIFKKGERIGIIGKNGVGKSSFLNVITGKEKANSGKIGKGETITFGYFTQTGIQLNEDKSVVE